MKIAVVPSHDITNTLYTEPVFVSDHSAAQQRAGYSVAECASGAAALIDCDVVVHSAHDTVEVPPRRDLWSRAVVVDNIPYANGEHTDGWMTFYTNVFNATFILCTAQTHADLETVGLGWLQPRCVLIDGVHTGYNDLLGALVPRTVVWGPTNLNPTEIKLRDALAHVVNADRKPPEAMRSVNPLTLAQPDDGVMICFNPHVTSYYAHYLTNTFGFVVFPRSAYARAGALLDCRQFHVELDRAWNIASTADGSAVNQYARSALNTMLDEVQQVLSSFGRVPFHRPQSNRTLVDVLFHAMNVRGMH